MPPGLPSGSPEALSNIAKANEARARKRAEREAQARAALGPAATPEQVSQWVRDAESAQRNATRAQNFAKKMQGTAQQFQRRVAVATTPPPPVETSQQQPVQPSSSLFDHPIFGASVRPGAAAVVELHRLPSSRVEHNVPGVSTGYLDTWEFDGFNKDSVRAKHGGGIFRAFAMDSNGRCVGRGDFPIAGMAKPIDQPPPPAAPQQHGAYRGLGGAFQVEPPQLAGEAPPWFWQYSQGQEDRLRRLEDLLERSLTPQPASEQDKFERWKQEQTEKDAQEERRHERKMEELRLQIDADNSRRLAEAKAQADAIATSQAAQANLMNQIVLSQSSQSKDLMTALVAQKQDGAAHFAPLMSGMAELVKAQNSQMSGMFGILRDAIGGEEKKTVTDRLIDMVDKRFDKAGDALILKLVEMIGKPREGQAALQMQPGSAFQLPDGRVVPPEICHEFVTKYQARNGVAPSLEVCVDAFTRLMDAAAQQARAQQQLAGLAPQQQAPLTPEEFVRRAGQSAAEAAVRGGASPEQAAQAARVAQQAAIQQIQAQTAAAQQAEAIRQAQLAAAQVQAVQQAQAFAAQAAPQNSNGAHPPPGQAAVEAAQQTQPGVPVAPAGTAPTTQPAAPPAPPIQAPPAQTATMLVEAVLPPPGDVVAIPWMSRNFLQDTVDAFQAGNDPIDFLERSLKSGKLSPDARISVGKLYEESDENESLTNILGRVHAMLAQRGVAMPATFIPAFKMTANGDAWLEAFLFGCSCSTVEEARKQIMEESKG